MKSPFKGGYSPSNRWSFDHHVAKKPTVWSEIIARPHLIVAAVGTVALVGLSGTAIWMALPDTRAQAQSAKPKAPAQLAVVAPAGQAATSTTAPAAAPKPLPVPKTAAATESQRVASAEATTTPEAAAAPAERVTAKPVPLLDSKNPRWVDSDGNAIEPADAPSTANDDNLESAFGDDTGASQDSAPTAAIPNLRPADAAKADAAAKALEPETKVASASAGTGRILRAVTMRSKPSSRGGVLGTVPAKTQVQVVSCSQWCEIVYKGKRGYIYKSFMSKGAR